MLPEIESNVEQPLAQPKLQGKDFGDRDTWEKVYDVVAELVSYNEFKHVVNILGLPTDTSREQIKEYLAAQNQIYYARQYGLPEDSPAEIIDAHRQKNNEWIREKAMELGLPPDASEQEVDEAERQKRAEQARLPRDASWQDVFRAEQEVRRERTFTALGLDPHKEWSWEEIIGRALCLPGHASTDDFVQRIQDVRTWQVEQFIQQIEADKPLKEHVSTSGSNQ